MSRYGSPLFFLQGILILVFLGTVLFGELSGGEAAMGIVALIAFIQGLAKIRRDRQSQTSSVAKSEKRGQQPEGRTPTQV
jgi:hypothetical protein